MNLRSSFQRPARSSVFQSCMLAEHEVAAVIRPLHDAQKEPEDEGIDDLAPVVEDAPVAIDDVSVFPHAGPILSSPPGAVQHAGGSLTAVFSDRLPVEDVVG